MYELAFCFIFVIFKTIK